MHTQAQKTLQVFIGGSFDPIHKGHMTMANMVHSSLTQLGCKHHIYFLPTAGSPFKSTQTTSADRVAMIQAAIQHTPFLLDDREINQTPPVYSIDTFTSIRTDFGQDSLVFVMGADSLTALPRWKNGFELPKLCHLWVFKRGDSTQKDNAQKGRASTAHDVSAAGDLLESVTNLVPEPLRFRITNSLESMINHSFGSVFLDERQPPAISSSHICQLLLQSCHTNDMKTLVSLAVWEYIKSKQLYRKI